MLFAKYVNPNAGYDCDKANCERWLILGFSYRVEEVNMGQSYTTIYLEDFPKLAFNSVNFEFFEGKDLSPINIYEDPRYNPYL